MLELRQVNIKFTEPVIEDGSLLIPDGELTALTGPSGSGKTTLLYCVGLVSSCKDYEYVFDGKQVDLSSEEEKGNLRKTKIGYIFQENNLNQNLTAGENVRLSASLAGADTGASRIRELLEQVGLSGQENSYPASLSGGEQQRLAIACALSVAFTALSTGYIKDFEEQQKRNMQAVSERELAVVRQNDPMLEAGKYDNTLPSMSLEMMDQLKELDHVVGYAPVLRFENRSGNTREYFLIDWDKAIDLEPGSLNVHISYQNRVNKAGSLEFCNWNIMSNGEEVYDPGDNYVEGGYSVNSYFTYESMDLKCWAIDTTVEPNQGIYMPSQIVDSFGLSKEDLDGLQMTIDVDIPVKRLVFSSTVFPPDEEEGYEVLSAIDLCVKEQITLPVRGFL